MKKIIISCLLLSIGCNLMAQLSLPQARSGFSMAYDKGDQSILLFGGQDSLGTKLADTWKWTQENGWEIMEVRGPAARINAAMCYSNDLKGIVLFGGLTDTGCTSDLWVWTKGQWQRFQSNEGPAPRQLATMAGNDRLILFGGKDDQNNRLGDTWELNDGRWTELSTGPTARSSHAMTYHSYDGRVLVYGGYDGQSLGDLWELRDNQWKQLEDSDGPPRLHGTLVFNVDSDHLMLFGGFGERGRTNDLYVMTHGEWNRIVTELSPPPRAEHESVFIPNFGLVIFGGVIGADPRSRIRANDMWVFRNGSWEQLN